MRAGRGRRPDPRNATQFPNGSRRRLPALQRRPAIQPACLPMPMHRSPPACMPEDRHRVELGSAHVTNPGNTACHPRRAARPGARKPSQIRSCTQGKQHIPPAVTPDGPALDCGRSSLSAFIEAVRQRSDLTPDPVMRLRHMQPAALMTTFSMEHCPAEAGLVLPTSAPWRDLA